MTVVSTTQDRDTLSFVVVAEFAAPPTRVWQIWADPRQLESWWGPPTYPATFEQHDLSVGGGSRYVMTGPDGSRSHGWWTVLSVDEPHSFEFEDGFADETGAPVTTMPTTRGHVGLEAIATGTRMTITSTFATAEQMDQLVAMGMVEGMSLALGQIDGVLART